MKLKSLISVFTIICILVTLTACSADSRESRMQPADGYEGGSVIPMTPDEDEDVPSRNADVMQENNDIRTDNEDAGEADDVYPEKKVSSDDNSETALSVPPVDVRVEFPPETGSNLEEALVNKIIENNSELIELCMQSMAAQNAVISDDDWVDGDSEEVDIDGLSYEDIEFLANYVKGTSDKSVAFIQQRLMDLGFMETAEPTEYYGSMTSEAVKIFQRQHELKLDGILGIETRTLLFGDDAKYYTAKKGMEGSDITRIQQRLYELGYLASKKLIDGKFGDDTDTAVKALQSANGLVADGKVGQMTVELMYSEGVVANLLSFGDKGDIILACQQRLKELGYLTTAPDGKYGNDTLAAVKLFQSRNNIVVDGYLGPSTREILDSSSAIANGLCIGDEGDTVKRVQQLLIKYGYMKSGSDTGYFGEVTDKAVKNFQKKNDLKVDGHVGVKTMTKLTGTVVVRAGDTGGGGTGGGSGQVDTGYASSGSVAELLEVALSKLGCKYVWGGKGPNTFDCSGFVYWCLNQVGVKQSYITSYGWRTVGKYKKVTKYKDLRAGDIIVVTGHVGIVGEDGTVIDASSSRSQIAHRKLSSWWSSRFICGWRIFD